MKTMDQSTDWRVVGVDKESGFDTELVINASTEANAKAKAELKGVMVTDVTPVNQQMAVQPAKPAKKQVPNKRGKMVCPQCEGNMIKATVSSGNVFGIVIALLVFAVGVILCFTVIGAIIGIPLCILALFIGGKRQKVWKCKGCKYYFQRA